MKGFIMIKPTKTELLSNTKYTATPIYKSMNEDMLTTMSLYKKLEQLAPKFILESVGNPEDVGRYTYIGIDGNELSATSNLTLLEIEKLTGVYTSPENLDLPPFHCGFIGYFSYESVTNILPVTLTKTSSIPQSQLIFAKKLLIVDHLLHKLHIVYNAEKSMDYGKEYIRAEKYIQEITELLDTTVPLSSKEELEPRSITIKSNTSKDAYIQNVNMAKKYIEEGEIFQVVLSQKFSVKCNLDPIELYRNVRRENPSPYLSYIRFKDLTTICSSPEILVKKIGDTVETAPIAGTRPILNDGKDDQRSNELLKDEKELAEHLMLVDLGRNDVGKISKPGTVTVNSFCKVKRYSKVMHLVSNVTGIVTENLSALDPIKATFPAGTVSGAPKIRAMEIIDELEKDNRNLYAGTIFYLNTNGNLNSCIAIRTLVIKDDEITIQAGGGIVYDSDPLAEYHESLNKAKALFKSIEMTHKGDVHYDFSY